jgi:hypothetical protein
MDVEQSIWHENTGWTTHIGSLDGREAQWVLLFGAPTSGYEDALSSLRKRYPATPIIGCSTAGEICDVNVHDDSLVATAVRFEHTQIQIARAMVSTVDDSYRAGTELAQQLRASDLCHVMVFSDGLNVNGTQLTSGLRDNLPSHIAVTGGLAGDGDRFKNTMIYSGDDIAVKQIVAMGFYGARLHVGYGSLGGWDSFGPLRRVTRAEANVLYELDGQSALDLYKRYLGEHASALPYSALLFPLALHEDGAQDSVVRTILSVDEAQGSMTFAGDIPQGAQVRLMKANFDRLVDGAAGAAQAGLGKLNSHMPQLAVLISCVGRKLVLKQRIEEEVEGVRNVLGPQPVLTGFYSYGEICPHGEAGKCELHNQTMTVTTFCEQ